MAIQEPTTDDEKMLNDVINNTKEKIKIGNITVRMGWVRYAARRKVTNILINESNETKVGSKCVAALFLNRRILIFLFYWLVWRWFYYVMEFTEEQYLPFVLYCKKKVDVPTYYLLTTLLIGMKDTTMKQTRKDAEQLLRAQK